jgi:hypothetical protein
MSDLLHPLAMDILVEEAGDETGDEVGLVPPISAKSLQTRWVLLPASSKRKLKRVSIALVVLRRLLSAHVLAFT